MGSTGPSSIDPAAGELVELSAAANDLVVADAG